MVVTLKPPLLVLAVTTAETPPGTPEDNLRLLVLATIKPSLTLTSVQLLETSAPKTDGLDWALADCTQDASVSAAATVPTLAFMRKNPEAAENSSRQYPTSI
jgi:hypothetical protein